MSYPMGVGRLCESRAYTSQPRRVSVLRWSRQESNLLYPRYTIISLLPGAMGGNCTRSLYFGLMAVSGVKNTHSAHPHGFNGRTSTRAASHTEIMLCIVIHHLCHCPECHSSCSQRALCLAFPPTLRLDAPTLSSAKIHNTLYYNYTHKRALCQVSCAVKRQRHRR